MISTRLSGRGITASAPGRVCLVGESLDWMRGGESVTAALPLRTRVTAWRAHGPTSLTLASGAPISATRIVNSRACVTGRYAGDVLDLMQAATKVAVQQEGQLGGVMLTASTDLPIAAGVSSSAALATATCAAFTYLDTTHPSTPIPEICSMAWRAETQEIGSGAGWMDFLAVAHGGVNHIDASTQTASRLAGTVGVPLVLVDTRERRATRTVLETKRTRWQAGDPALLDYATQTSELVAALDTLIRAPSIDYVQVGEVINTAHRLLRDNMRCSTALLDICAERAIEAGAFGAKLTGSGHGGCLFALVAEDAVTDVLAALNTLPVYAVALPAMACPGLAVEPVAVAPYPTAPTRTEGSRP